jgi:hypothetical protein
MGRAVRPVALSVLRTIDLIYLFILVYDLLESNRMAGWRAEGLGRPRMILRTAARLFGGLLAHVFRPSGLFGHVNFSQFENFG